MILHGLVEVLGTHLEELSALNDMSKHVETNICQLGHTSFNLYIYRYYMNKITKKNTSSRFRAVEADEFGISNICATSRLEGCSRAASAAVWNTVGKAFQKPNVVGLRTVWVILIKILELWPAKLPLNIKLKRLRTRLFLLLCIWVLAFVSFDKVLQASDKVVPVLGKKRCALGKCVSKKSCLQQERIGTLEFGYVTRFLMRSRSWSLLACRIPGCGYVD